MSHSAGQRWPAFSRLEAGQIQCLEARDAICFPAGWFSGIRMPTAGATENQTTKRRHAT